MEIKVIHISEVLKLMNKALMNHQKVNLKAWKLGTGPNDPERGELKTYSGVYVTSHSKTAHTGYSTRWPKTRHSNTGGSTKCLSPNL